MVMKYLEQIRGKLPVQKIPESSKPTPPSILSNSSIISVDLPLKMRDHHSLHPHPELVNQVQLVVYLLAGPPLVPAVLDHISPGIILVPQFCSPYSQGIKVGDMEHTVLSIEGKDIVIQLLHLLLPVACVGGRHMAIVLIQHKFSWTQQWGHSELVIGSRVIPVVLGDHVPEVGDRLHDRLPGSPLHQII